MRAGMTGSSLVARCMKGDEEKWLGVGQEQSPGGTPTVRFQVTQTLAYGRGK